jgi:hypothetical protein
MNRRGFIAALAGAFVADPEKLLWVPGKKLISIPAPRKNYILTPEEYTREVLRQLSEYYTFKTLQNAEEVLNFKQVMGTGVWNRLKVGDTVKIRKPPRFVTRIAPLETFSEPIVRTPPAS